LDQITAAWDSESKRLFEQLRKAAKAYFDASSTDEMDMSGTARAAIAISANESFEREFMEALRGFEAGKLPMAKNFPDADVKLNEAYRKAIASIETSDIRGTIDTQGIRKAERLWLSYRDAWARLGPARYPSVSKDVWLAWASEQRAKRLENLVSCGEVDCNPLGTN
jgi:uncharacterized protein YecT (DUF1311 family)